MPRHNFNPVKRSRVVNDIEMKELKCGWYIFETKVNHLVEAKAYYSIEADSKHGRTFEDAQEDFINHINQVKQKRKWH
mgnify:CR=1 FL=1|jgi:hypothetical protein|tara:strand:+ start:735 stop:968 length:234 start_codon:yes stop_codon:yes gene_type:complete